MKTLKLLICLSFSLFYFSSSYGQSWLWGAGCYGPVAGNGAPSPVATDKKGNVYVTDVSQDDSVVIGNYVLNTTKYKAYMVKYSSSGNVIWAKIGGGNSIATDELGNVYAAGSFGDTLKIGAFTLLGIFGGGTNTYLAKYDSNGNVIWAKQSKVPSKKSGAVVYCVRTDNFNNIFLTGRFVDTVAFGNYMLSMNYNANHGNADAFLVKYDSAGNVLWAQQSENSLAINAGGVANSVTADKFGNAYITGNFFDTISFGAFSLSTISSAGFLVKYSATGNVLWAKQSVNNFPGYSETSSIITDAVNNVYITGSFEDSVMFGAHTIYSPSVISMFLAKYDANGNAIWAKSSSEKWISTALASDIYNHIYLTGSDYAGQNTDSFKFNGYTLYSNPSSIDASYILKMDTTGNVLCGSMLNNLNVESVDGLASDYTGTYVYTASIIWNGSVVCGPDVLTATGHAPNSFVGRWLPCDVYLGINSITPQNGNVVLYPNPSNGIFQLEIKNYELGMNSSVEVYNMLGEKVYSTSLLISNSSFLINLCNQPNGIYLYRVITETGELVGDGKLMIER